MCHWFKAQLEAGSPGVDDVNPCHAGLLHLFKPSRARPNVMPDGISTVSRDIEVRMQFPPSFYPSSLDMSFSFILSLPLYATCRLVSSSYKSLFPFLSVSCTLLLYMLSLSLHSSVIPPSIYLPLCFCMLFFSW